MIDLLKYYGSTPFKYDANPNCHVVEWTISYGNENILDP
jgi:hypothetical protein